MSSPSGSFQARLKFSSIAGLIRFYKKQGVPILTRSNLLHMIVEDFMDILEKNELAGRVEDMDEAAGIIRKSGLPTVSRHRSNKELINAITKVGISKKADERRIKAMVEEAVERLEEK